MLMLRLMRDGDHIPEIEKQQAPGDLFYLALNGEELLGYCRFRRGKETVYLTQVVDHGDPSLGDGLIRAALAYAMDGGVDRAVFGDFVDMGRYARFGYRLDEENCIKSISDFLNNCQGCKTES